MIIAAIKGYTRNYEREKNNNLGEIIFLLVEIDDYKSFNKA